MSTVQATAAREAEPERDHAPLASVSDGAETQGTRSIDMNQSATAISTTMNGNPLEAQRHRPAAMVAISMQSSCPDPDIEV